MKNRQPRFRVMLPAQMRWDGRWITASVRNVSSRGLMVCSTDVPPVGTYVELLVGAETITARSVWAGDQACGLQTRSDIDFARLRAPAASAGGRTNVAEFGVAARQFSLQPDRRRDPGHSRHLSNLLQYFTASVVGAMVAGSIGWEVYHTLAAPISTVTLAMAGAK